MSLEPIYPFGIHTAQTWDQIGAYWKLIHDHRITTFIELGVHAGGLAMMFGLHVTLTTKFTYLGVEKDREVVNPLVRAMANNWAPRMSILFDDVFEPSTYYFVKGCIVNSEGPVLLLCDDGNKPREALKYSTALRSGDLLAVHDYGTEIRDRDFEPLAGKYRIELISTCLVVWRRL